MIDFLAHEKGDLVGVATVDIKSGQIAKGVYMDSQETLEVKAFMDIPLGHKIALADLKVGNSVLKYGTDIGKVVAPISKGASMSISII